MESQVPANANEMDITCNFTGEIRLASWRFLCADIKS